MLIADAATRAQDQGAWDAADGAGPGLLLAQGRPDRVRIRSLDDIALGTWNGTSDLTGSDAACVFSSTTAYTVVATGDGPGGSFVLAAGPGGTLPYAVEWTDDRGTTATLVAGRQSGIFSAQTNSAACQGGTNTTIRIRVTSDNAEQALSGLYGGTLTLEISPSN